jgi:squalene-hopene/tetraprenyl-beta-curcumene cyclase
MRVTRHFKPLCKLLTALFLLLCAAESVSAEDLLQYEHGDVSIAAPSGDEALRNAFSATKALRYIEQGAVAWSEQRGCVSCHTNGAYLQLRTELSPLLGAPSKTVRDTFVKQLHYNGELSPEKKRYKITPTQTAYVAAGLTAWDRFVDRKLSSESRDALKLLFEVQSDDGSWGNDVCWPPLESSTYHGATAAAMAVANWNVISEKDDSTDDEFVKSGIERMKQYLRKTTPPHDYGRVLLLWADSRLPGLIKSASEKQAIVDRIFSLQKPDGGWSLRSFSSPESWGNGNRDEKLRTEPEYANPPSDGHQTGLCVLVLREAGIAAKDARLQKAVSWLLSNQRVSGRWWTRSLNTDRYHYITYTGTLYPLLALNACGVSLTGRERAAPGDRTRRKKTF